MTSSKASETLSSLIETREHTSVKARKSDACSMNYPVGTIEDLVAFLWAWQIDE